MSGAPSKDTRPITERIRAQLSAGAGSRGATFPTLDELKDMLGIPPGDTSLDDEITDAFAATIAIVENYLGRGIALKDEVQPFEPVETRNPRLLLFRFPVQEVRSVTVDGGTVTGWRVFPASGILEWGRHCAPRYCYGGEPLVSVDYTGGYLDDAWPADLMDAILRAFFARWQATGGTGNTADASLRPVSSVSLDGSSVAFSEPGVNAAEYGGKPWPPELQGVVAILEPYRARSVTGV